MTPLAAALGYAKRGMYVFPCWPGKKTPMTEKGLLEATTDPKQITSWWKRSPYANVAIATGPSGIVVVDVDPKNGGDSSFEDMRADLGAAAFETNSHTTPSGGTHYLFRAPSEPVHNSAGDLAPGIDIRGMGGYILVPPSRNGQAPYVWEVSSREITLADFPKALQDRLRPKRATFETADAVIEGGRNQYLTSMAGALRRKGLSANEIHAAIGIANKDRCKPPLEESEVGAIARSVGRYTPSDPLKPVSINALGLLTFDQLCERTSQQVDWMIEGLLRQSGLMLLAGRPKVGKSALARNLALSVATGTPFVGRRCLAGKVIWLGLEEPASELRDKLEIMGAQGLPILYRVDPFSGDELEWLRLAVDAERPAMVIIDTIGRFSKIENINDYSQVTRATQPILDLRDRFGTTFVLLHHNNNSNSPLGSTQWQGVPDVILSLTKNDDETRFIKSLGQRSGLELEPTALTLDHDTGRIVGEESRSIADQRTAEQKILRAVETDQQYTREQLARLGARKLRYGRAAVDALTSAGFFKTIGSGSRGDPRFYVAINPEESRAPEEQLLSPFLRAGGLKDEEPGRPDGRAQEKPEESPMKPARPEESEEPELIWEYAVEKGLL
jgi:hypothetical protein